MFSVSLYNSSFEIHKMLGNSRVAEQLAASQEGLSSMELVTQMCSGQKRERRRMGSDQNNGHVC
jgi:hypothetical protein